LTGDLSRTITNASEAMSDMAESMEALKRSFFFRGFVNNRGFYDLDKVTVAEYREGKFAGGKLRQQSWIYETELFAHGSDGSEELSAAGKSRLDAVMAEFQRYLRNSAIIVEGYSGKGLTSEQFFLSTDRALKVREYLVKKFQLDPNYVGTMPMGAVASKDNSGAYWEGVAVVVFYDKPD